MPNPGDFTPTNLEYTEHADHDEDYAAVGGEVQRYVAGAALNVGDLVYFSAVNGVVNKSTTQANYLLFAGVVVGGNRTTGGRALSRSQDVGLPAAAANELALVQVSGKAFVTTGAAVTAPVKVTGDTTTAGRVISTGATAGQIAGIALQSAGAAAGVVLMQIDHM